MVAKGRVLAAHADGRLAVELAGPEACPGCRCGRLVLASNKHRTKLVLDAQAPVRIGEEILVTMPAVDVLRGALWLHGLPLTGLLAGALAAAAAGFGDLGCLAGAAAGLSGALLLLRRIQRRWHSAAARGLRVAPTA